MAYGHQAHRDLAQAQGLRLRPLPADANGAVILTASPSGLDQLTLAEFIDSGGYDRQIRRTRLAYRRRRDRLAAALGRQGQHVTGIAAGLHAVLDPELTGQPEPAVPPTGASRPACG